MADAQREVVRVGAVGGRDADQEASLVWGSLRQTLVVEVQRDRVDAGVLGRRVGQQRDDQTIALIGKYKCLDALQDS